MGTWKAHVIPMEVPMETPQKCHGKPEVPRNSQGSPMGTSRKHNGNLESQHGSTVGTPKSHGSPIWEHHGSTRELRSPLEVPWSFHGPSMGLPWDSHWAPLFGITALPWNFRGKPARDLHGTSMRLQCFHGISMGLPWKTIMGLPRDFHGSSMGHLWDLHESLAKVYLPYSTEYCTCLFLWGSDSCPKSQRVVVGPELP